ncbi:enoyl-CoA hydratase-related protein [Phytohabitans sp. LJ34]|uniref:enoyl-CoA hydratase-related protein n=1 Tax=Phytohabitans sp. LJ34 TaxID=3452217 RepID=UPI003F8A1616
MEQTATALPTAAVRTDRLGPVATVTLCGTRAGNAIGGAVFTRLPAVLAELGEEESVKAIVLRGPSDVFSVGLDLRWYLPLYRRTMRRGDDGAAARRALMAQTRSIQDAVSAVESCPVPVVAAVAGPCVGAALELVSACDVRLASADATFAAREVEIDVVPDLGLLQRLPRIVGEGATAYLALTGASISAAEAFHIGLVWSVADDADGVYRAAATVAAGIAAHERHVLHGIKHVLHASRDIPVGRGLDLSAVWTAAFMPTTELPDRLRRQLAGPEPDANPQ